MRFRPAPEQLDFASALGDLLADSDVPSVARAWARGDSGPGRKVWCRLAEQGMLALGVDAQHGGVGATAVDLVLGFEQLGRAGVPGPYVESVAVLPVLLGATPEAGRLEEIAGGELMATLAMPPHVPFALDGAVADVVYLLDAGALSLARVTGTAESVDATRHLAAVSADEPVADAGEPPAAGEPVESVRAASAFDLGVLATAAQILGAGSALLERSTRYAKQRVQFGRPIGSFQAVKHLLADAAVALELARPLLFGAALALGTPTAARDVSAAKVACTDAAYRSARTALQVHGAIGYTAEYDLSLWLTKVRALTSAWGTQAHHRSRVLEAIR
jgi:alkylation response protein AidB-like acyl-CoA dehydrogenase